MTLASAAVFFLLGYSTGLMFNYSGTESLVIELAMVFSSTIIGIKLLPTKVLH